MEKMQEIEEEDRSYVIHKYIQKLRESKSTCSDCNRMFYKSLPIKWYVKPETSTLCNDCWVKPQKESSVEIWKKIFEYKPESCVVCHSTKEKCPNNYYFYNNENMFDKKRSSIADLVNQRAEWDVIQFNLDKSRGVCNDCELVLNDILLKLNYVKVKWNIEKQLADGIIDSENAESQMAFFTEDYETKMKEIVGGLSEIFTNLDPN